MQEDIKTVLKKLQEAGIPADGTWHKSEAREAKAPIIEKQKELLSKLTGVLEMQIEQDKQLVADLQAKLVKIKHGGGS